MNKLGTCCPAERGSPAPGAGVRAGQVSSGRSSAHVLHLTFKIASGSRGCTGGGRVLSSSSRRSKAVAKICVVLRWPGHQDRQPVRRGVGGFLEPVPPRAGIYLNVRGINTGHRDVHIIVGQQSRGNVLRAKCFVGRVPGSLRGRGVTWRHAPRPAPGLPRQRPDPPVAASPLGNPKHLLRRRLWLCFSLDHTGAGEHGHTRPHAEACTLSFRPPVFLNKSKKRACVAVSGPCQGHEALPGRGRGGSLGPSAPVSPAVQVRGTGSPGLRGRGDVGLPAVGASGRAAAPASPLPVGARLSTCLSSS